MRPSRKPVDLSFVDVDSDLSQADIANIIQSRLPKL